MRLPAPAFGLRGSELRIATIFSMALTIFLTWPQAWHLGTAVAAHADPYFSMWRLAWIAHALPTDPARVFDANIFHPETGTLAYSDATFLQGLVGAPLLWMGLSPVLVYNLLLLGGIAGSGVGMFVLARTLTGSLSASLVASAIFLMAPYRIEHFMHLELQWTMWIPLTFWALHRTFDEPSWRAGALVGVLLWLQVLSSVYYGVFLAIAAGVFVVTLAAIRPGDALRAAPWLALGGAVAAILSLPYALQYLGVADTVGSRPIETIREYSARPASYLASPPQNWLWGWTADRWGSAELRLFPGLVACLLAGAGLFGRPRSLVVLYVLLAGVAVALSLGMNAPPYAWLVARLDVLQGLRAPSRFAIVAMSALALMAALGVQTLARAMHQQTSSRTSSTERRQGGLVASFVLILLVLEYRNTGMLLAEVRPMPVEAYNVQHAARALGPGVVLELPLPPLHALPGKEPEYAFWSIGTWLRRVNGYSGYYPPSYMRTATRLESFPDATSVAYLQRLGVRYIIVHETPLGAEGYKSLVLRMTGRPELRPHGAFRDPEGEAALFVLEP